MERKTESFKKSVFEWIESIVIAVVAVTLIFTFVFRTVSIDGSSMLPTLTNGDTVLVYELFYTPKPGDIIVLSVENNNNKPYIKRVIAVEGQTVDIDFDAGVVYVDGKAVDDSYTYTPTNLRGDMRFPITVGKDQVFVLGDNRNDSEDSRSSRVGLVDRSHIVGKAVFRLFPNTGVI